MTELKKFNKLQLNTNILNLPSQSHKRREYIRSFLTKELFEELVVKMEYSANYISLEIFKPKGYIIDPGTIINFSADTIGKCILLFNSKIFRN